MGFDQRPALLHLTHNPTRQQPRTHAHTHTLTHSHPPTPTQSHPPPTHTHTLLPGLERVCGHAHGPQRKGPAHADRRARWSGSPSGARGASWANASPSDKSVCAIKVPGSIAAGKDRAWDFLKCAKCLKRLKSLSFDASRAPPTRSASRLPPRSAPPGSTAPGRTTTFSSQSARPKRSPAPSLEFSPRHGLSSEPQARPGSPGRRGGALSNADGVPSVCLTSHVCAWLPQQLCAQAATSCAPHLASAWTADLIFMPACEPACCTR